MLGHTRLWENFGCIKHIQVMIWCNYGMRLSGALRKEKSWKWVCYFYLLTVHSQTMLTIQQGHTRLWENFGCIIQDFFPYIPTRSLSHVLTECAFLIHSTSAFLCSTVSMDSPAWFNNFFVRVQKVIAHPWGWPIMAWNDISCSTAEVTTPLVDQN